MKKYIISGGVALMAIFALFSSVSANPSFFSPGGQSATATTTVSYLTTGAGTTTPITFDTYNSGSTVKTNSATLLTQFAGSSTASILKINVEYSQDGVDWYQDNVNSQMATTTGTAVPLTVVNSYSWTFASTTPGGAAVTNANSATSTKAVNLVAPTRYLRVYYTLTGTAGAVWGQIVPVKEKNE